MRALALAVAAFSLAAAVATAAPAARDPWTALHRPLRLRQLAPGARCPVTPARPLDGGRLRGLGAGPAYPMPTRFEPYDRLPGWLGSKTLWAWPTALVTRRERVLVRGRRLDRPGALRFQLGPQWDTAPATRELRLDTTRTVGSFGDSDWGATVTMLLVRAPGCYGLQLDSERGTSTIVVSARR